jgi:hypothetical protein
MEWLNDPNVMWWIKTGTNGILTDFIVHNAIILGGAGSLLFVVSKKTKNTIDDGIAEWFKGFLGKIKKGDPK